VEAAPQHSHGHGHGRRRKGGSGEGSSKGPKKTGRGGRRRPSSYCTAYVVHADCRRPEGPIDRPGPAAVYPLGRSVLQSANKATLVVVGKGREGKGRASKEGLVCEASKAPGLLKQGLRDQRPH
jgi:hypothetical protein